MTAAHPNPGTSTLADASRLGARLRALREARGWSQAELARRAGVHENTVRFIEAKPGRAHWNTVCQLANALEASLEELARE